MNKKFNIATELYIEEANRRGVKSEVIYPGKVLKFSYNNHVEFTYDQFFSCFSAVAYKSCENKAVTKTFLEKVGIAVPLGKEYSLEEYDPALHFAKDRNYGVVLKPLEGKKGISVFSGINDEQEFKMAWDEIFRSYSAAILEEKFQGDEYRIIATREKTLAVVCRKPANIVGDGSHTVHELIDLKNSDPRRSDDAGDPVVKIKIDNIVLSKLKSQNLSLHSILKKGQLVFLRNNSNLSTGGESMNVTDIAHRSVKEIGQHAINAIPGLPFGGVDFMTKDISKPQETGTYVIIEINASPGIDMHHFPYEGKSINVAKEIIDIIFPETAMRKK
jgi:cyanophycin synthetase